MRHIFGCAVLCLGLSAADSLAVQPASASIGSEAADFTPSRMIEEAQPPRPADEAHTGAKAEADKRPASREEICNSVASAAQAHDLPIAFLASLVWQESRFEPKAVSPVGALGIAQFMPRIAAAYGVADPFDPIQALPGSAKFLRELFDQFGNLGLAAAAYNAGPKRVLDWMARRGNLPAETRTYVLAITGRPADQWVTKIDNTGFKIPARTPCQTLASLPEWSLAGSGQLNPDLPDVKDKPMIVITKTKVIVTGPRAKTLAIKQPKTKLALAVQPKDKVAKAQASTIVVTKSKVVITAAASTFKLASAEKKSAKPAQPQSILAAEPKERTRVASLDKKDAPTAGRIKPAVAAAKLAGKAGGKAPVRPASASRVRTAAAGG